MFKGKISAAPSVPQLDLLRWYESVAGKQLLSLENQLVAEGVHDLFGYHLASIGSVSYLDGIAASPITHKIVINHLKPESNKPSLLSDAQGLSLLNDSVDVLVLPHVLEYADQPHAILREAERVLHANGHVVILGFNPLSCYGICRAILGLTGRMPWQGHFYQPARLRDWLKLLGFEVVKTQYAAFTPPIQHEKTWRYLSFLESIKKTFVAPLGGVYMIVARNLAVTPNVVRPKWSSRATLIKNGAIEPSSRTINQRVVEKIRVNDG